MKPYSYKGTAYRRVGNTTLEMSRDAQDRVLIERVHSDQRWENQPATGWSVDDLDLSEILLTVEESIRRGRVSDPGTRDPEELLRGLGLVKEGVLLRAAVVLFGKTERVEVEMSQCLLRVARFRGIDRAEFLDNRQFRDNAFGLLLKAERFMRENLPVAGRIVPNLFERVDEPLYPPEALREALANAFCHRDYTIGGGSVAVAVCDDRLEVTSSGTLHFGLTAEQLFLPHESLPWNPLIANVFYRRGIIEQWGRGTIKMAELTTSAGLPQPEIEDAGGCVTVRFRPGRYVPPQRIGRNLTERQQAILALLDQSRSRSGAAGDNHTSEFASHATTGTRRSGFPSNPRSGRLHRTWARGALEAFVKPDLELFRAYSGLIPGLFRAYSGLFRAYSGLFRAIPGLFRAIPGLFRPIQSPAAPTQLQSTFLGDQDHDERNTLQRHHPPADLAAAQRARKLPRAASRALSLPSPTGHPHRPGPPALRGRLPDR